ncbi:hypothetical protein ACJIZ3_004590 [Penstemon smallii]|uniref:RING-type E3 ubiquitin transferase n=1 Tax=Penstemon smallii TaxID=265156 RepID=A0ABD3S2G9_9LAMI
MYNEDMRYNDVQLVVSKKYAKATRMGHRNTQFSGHKIEMETDQQGQSHLHPQPCFFYGNVANIPQPNFHSVVPAPVNQGFFNLHHMPEQHDNALFYGPQYNALQPQHPSSHYSPYLAPLSSVQVNQVAHDIRGSFKRKNAEGAFANNQYHTALAGPSSLASMIARPVESHIGQMELTVESGPLRSVRNRPAVIEHNPSHLIQGNYVGPPVQFPGNPSLDVHFGVNNGDNGTYAWSQAPNLPYVHACVNVARLESGHSGIQGYQMTASNRSSTGFLHPPISQGHPNCHQPMQEVRGYNVNFPSQMATSTSHRIPTTSSSNTSYLALVPPTGFRLYRPHQREIVLDSNARHRSLPQLRVLPVDNVAPGYYEVGDSFDQHRDMRLDIDQMSYEELLALGERIGCVGTGLYEEFIENNLNIRTFTSSAACVNIGEATCPDHQINFCVICQNDYEDEENIGTLDCEHEYHGECIKKWLLVKNTCPVCKSTALSVKGKKDL